MQLLPGGRVMVAIRSGIGGGETTSKTFGSGREVRSTLPKMISTSDGDTHGDIHLFGLAFHYLDSVTGWTRQGQGRRPLIYPDRLG